MHNTCTPNRLALLQHLQLADILYPSLSYQQTLPLSQTYTHTRDLPYRTPARPVMESSSDHLVSIRPAIPYRPSRNRSLVTFLAVSASILGLLLDALRVWVPWSLGRSVKIAQPLDGHAWGPIGPQSPRVLWEPPDPSSPTTDPQTLPTPLTGSSSIVSQFKYSATLIICSMILSIS